MATEFNTGSDASLNEAVKSRYEANADTNAFTDAEKSKLGGVASGAEVNAVDSVNGATGAVSLNADDIDDGATAHKFATAAQLSKIDGVESGATADQTGAELVASLNAEIGTSDWAIATFTNANTYDFDGLLNTVSPQSYEIVFDAIGEFISTLGTAAKSSAADFATPSQLTKVVDIAGDYNTARPNTPSPVQWINCFGIAPNNMDPSKGDSYDDVSGNTQVVYLAADTDLDDTHFGKTIVVNGGSSITLTVRSQANYAWTGGAERGFNIASENGESISVVFQAGVDINGTTAGTITIPDKGLAWFRRKVAGDDWRALGSGAS